MTITKLEEKDLGGGEVQPVSQRDIINKVNELVDILNTQHEG